MGLESSALNFCSQNPDISAAADELGELAALIDEVGLEDLEEQLGADLTLDFSFDPPGSTSF